LLCYLFWSFPLILFKKTLGFTSSSSSSPLLHHLHATFIKNSWEKSRVDSHECYSNPNFILLPNYFNCCERVNLNSNSLFPFLLIFFCSNLIPIFLYFTLCQTQNYHHLRFKHNPRKQHKQFSSCGNFYCIWIFV